jgi:hypothetical protein
LTGCETVAHMSEQKKVQLHNLIAVALLDELGRVPTKDEVERYARLARVLYKAVLGTHFERKLQQQNGQLRIF